jgi:glycopeptide antibiotics resistance protein
MNFLGLALLPSIGLETAQYLIPYRSFDLNDLIVNLLGIFSGLFAYFYRPSCKYILD